MQILVVDLGGQYTKLISDRLREYCNVRSIILSPKKAEEWLAEHTPKGIILSGGYASANDKDAPNIDKILSLSLDVPILGICLGMHLLVKKFGGVVESRIASRGFGECYLHFENIKDPLFEGVSRDKSHGEIVWMSHGDSVEQVPEGFDVSVPYYAGYAAFASEKRKIWALQFHPEVKETECGEQIFKNFAMICGAMPDWKPSDVISEIQEYVASEMPNDGRCVLAYSGGVDSSVLLKILQPVLGSRIIPVTIDAGNLRRGETEEILENAMRIGYIPRWLDCKERFFRALKEINNPRRKREMFGRHYAGVLDDFAREQGIKSLLQGTLAPDKIESARVGEADIIKLHHNLAEIDRTSDIENYLKLVHPLGDLFKYEVRDIARFLGLQSSIADREPFPGPGLFIRTVGEVTQERVKIIRWADYRVREIIKGAQAEKELSQLVVALFGILTTGVKGDKGVLGYPIVIRAVRTFDFMTAYGYEISPDLRKEIKVELTKHNDIVRVLFDETDKPCATIEFE